MEDDLFDAMVVDALGEDDSDSEESTDTELPGASSNYSKLTSFFSKRADFSHVAMIKDLEKRPKLFKSYMRMELQTYKKLLQKVTPYFADGNTITPHERLSATLRYLSTGMTFEALKFEVLISNTQLSEIVMETCQIIMLVLKSYIQMPKSVSQCKKIAEQFESKWQFPNCLGAIDGKHVEIEKPANSGNQYLNYKGTYSIVLLAIVDANKKFLMVDVGAEGRSSDSSILQRTSVWKALEEGEFKLPHPRIVGSFEKPLPYVFVGDSAFPLTKNIMKPYGDFANLSQEKATFNYRLSRARVCVENSFGQITTKFYIFKHPINASPENAAFMTAACCYLFNFIKSCENAEDDDDDSDDEDSDDEDSDNENMSFERTPNEIRDDFCEYFNTHKI